MDVSPETDTASDCSIVYYSIFDLHSLLSLVNLLDTDRTHEGPLQKHLLVWKAPSPIADVLPFFVFDFIQTLTVAWIIAEDRLR